jgi:AmmeMemoRadiSam system protein A
MPLSSPLSKEERRQLLALARRAILEAVARHRILDLPTPLGQLSGRLAERRGVFVSLHRRGRLRGCVGRSEASRPLAEAVAQCAISAALNDPRFAPVAEDELGELSIEISVLTEPRPLPWQAIEAGKHGLLVVRGTQRGLLLPQVAGERHWSAQRFLEETCRKAGLDPGAWRDGETQFFGFTVEAFSEAELQQA